MASDQEAVVPKASRMAPAGPESEEDKQTAPQQDKAVVPGAVAVGGAALDPSAAKVSAASNPSKKTLYAPRNYSSAAYRGVTQDTADPAAAKVAASKPSSLSYAPRNFDSSAAYRSTRTTEAADPAAAKEAAMSGADADRAAAKVVAASNSKILSYASRNYDDTSAEQNSNTTEDTASVTVGAVAVPGPSRVTFASDTEDYERFYTREDGNLPSAVTASVVNRDIEDQLSKRLQEFIESAPLAEVADIETWSSGDSNEGHHTRERYHTDEAHDTTHNERSHKGPETRGVNKKKWILISIAAVLLVGGAIGAAVSLSGGNDDSSSPPMSEVAPTLAPGSTPPPTRSPGMPLVFDDLEHGAPFVNGWFIALSNVGMGRIGLNRTDVPPENGGTFSLETWWGSGGVPGFLGLFGRRNPVDLSGTKYFNFWVNPDPGQSYTLNINLQEDHNDDGLIQASDDEEFDYNCTVSPTGPCARAGGGWQLVSIHLADFRNDRTFLSGGNGVRYDGLVQNIVFVVMSEFGGNVTFRTDYWAFSTEPLGDVPCLTLQSRPTPGTPVVFDDMEHGNPFGNGWFNFDSEIGGGGIGPNQTDLPPQDGGSFSLEIGWGSGGVSGFLGGFGRRNRIDLSGATHFNFWINPDPDQTYTLAINLQDDDNNDADISSPNDDEFQYTCAVSPTGPCVQAGAGWQLVSIALTNFTDDNSIWMGGNGILDAVPCPTGNGELINIVFTVNSTSGSDVTFRTDYWTLSAGRQG